MNLNSPIKNNENLSVIGKTNLILTY